MRFTRDEILKKMNAKIHINGHVIGAASCSGMTCKYSVMGGADIVLALSAGKFRHMGRSSYGSLLCYSNSNDLVMEFASRELLPIIQDTPVLFGFHANDPYIHTYEYLKDVKRIGFAGINNFPTMGLIDGQFGKALEEEGNTYQNEVEAIRIAHFLDLFTIAFVFNDTQTRQMLDAGADIICTHLGLTTGGMLGAKKTISLEQSCVDAQRMYDICNKVRPDVIKMVYGGPIKTPIDARYFYDNTDCQGFIGGSSIERIPAEKAILNTTKAFNTSGALDDSDIMFKVLGGRGRDYDYVDYVKTYISSNYGKPIYISELALAAHVSSSYLSTKFKKVIGCSFTEYLIKFRIHKFCEIVAGAKCQIPLNQAADLAGYPDYTQFSKTFKKYKGVSPKDYNYLT